MAIKAVHLGKTASQDENALVYALRRMNLQGAGDNIRRKMIETAIDFAFDQAKLRCPVGGDGDPHPGKMRDSLYKEVTQTQYLIRGKVAIPASIPYRFAVIFGDKRHKPNRFMEIALAGAIKYVMKMFPAIVKESFGEARGK
jgi:hypothetical protein